MSTEQTVTQTTQRTPEQLARIASLRASLSCDKICTGWLASHGAPLGSPKGISMQQATQMQVVIMREWLSLLVDPADPDREELKVLVETLYPLSNPSGYAQYLTRKLGYFVDTAGGSRGAAMAMEALD